MNGFSLFKVTISIYSFLGSHLITWTGNPLVQVFSCPKITRNIVCSVEKE